MKYIISIPEPCNENWENMTPTEQGRFCAVCTKEVFDMTTLSNRALVNKLKNNENICGRYKASQLDVDLYANSNTGLSRFGLLFSLTSLFAISQPALAQQNTTKTAIQNKDAKLKTPLETNDVLRDSITIRGTVKDDMGPVIGANVVIKGTTNSTVTDFDGKFELKITKPTKKIVLVASMAGDSVEVLVKDTSAIINIEFVTLEATEHVIMMGAVQVTKNDLATGKFSKYKLASSKNMTKSKKSFFTRITNLFRKKENKR